MSPHVKRMNMAFVMIDEKLSDVSDRLAGNPHVATIEVPLPDQPAREAFIKATTLDAVVKDFSDFDAAELAKLTAGISLTDLNVLIQSARESGKRLDANAFRALKKRLLERQSGLWGFALDPD
jgi:SpoVK/Ycf46/Vps4 family AAA+-type ATPase